MDSEMIVEVGQITVAIILAVGTVGLAWTGRPLDGVAPGFMAVLGFLYGGALVKSATSKASALTGTNVVNAIGASSQATHTVASDVQQAASTLVSPSEQPANG